MQDSGKLGLGDGAFAKPIIILEELSDSDSLHDDLCLDLFDDIIESLVVMLELLGSVERVHQIELSNIFDKVVLLFGFGVLPHSNYHILQHLLDVVHVFAEPNVVDFLRVPIVHVLPSQQVKLVSRHWHQVQLRQHSRELLSGDVRTSRPVEVLKRLFQHYSSSPDLMLDLQQQLVDHFLFSRIVDGLSFSVVEVFLGLVDLIKLVFYFLTELCVVN